ncbi:MAG: hypothetical protein C7N36_12095, partial [Bacteroidetes bacterium]
MKVIIADTSCLIIYHKIGQFKILQETFSDLIEIIGSLGVLIKAKGPAKNNFPILIGNKGEN